MTTVFDTAAEVLHADPNMSVSAVYMQGGRGAGMTVRIIRSRGGGVAQAFGRELRVTEEPSISVLAADCTPEKGDTWVLEDGTILTAVDAERSVEGASWTVTVR